MTEEQLKFEKLKLVYDKVAEHHKHYLLWRQHLLAGFLAVISILFYVSYFFYDKGLIFRKIIFLVFIVAALVALFFLQLEKRNRDLYHVCQRVGKRIESELFTDLNPEVKDNTGLFFTLDNSYKNTQNWTHAKTVDTLYITVGIISIILALVCLLTLTFNICN
jgi:hypothetical protein